MSFNESFSEPTGQTVEVIGSGRRLVAFLIDSIVLSVVDRMFRPSIGLVAALLTGGSEDAATGINRFVLSFLVGAGYFAVFWVTTGQTLGKMAMGIKVISTDGSAVSWGKALLRYIGYIVSIIPLLLGFLCFQALLDSWDWRLGWSGTWWRGALSYILGSTPLLLGFIWATFDAKRQGWHDKIASTYVVRKDTHFSATDDITFVPSDSRSSAELLGIGLVIVYIVFLLVFAAIVTTADGLDRVGC